MRTEAGELERLLDDLHEVLRDGRLAELAGIGNAVIAAVGRLGSGDKDRLAAIRERAVRNTGCLLAAGRGLRSAQRRIAEIRTLAAGSNAYDRNGRRTDPAGQPAQIDRRF